MKLWVCYIYEISNDEVAEAKMYTSEQNASEWFYGTIKKYKENGENLFRWINMCELGAYASIKRGRILDCVHIKVDVLHTEYIYKNTSVFEPLLKALWKLFEDIPMNPKTEQIEEEFIGFKKGTPRDDIWHWFDERYSKGVHALLYGEETNE